MVLAVSQMLGVLLGLAGLAYLVLGRIDRNCIAAMAAPFAEKAVGTVACIYKGLAVHGPVASFGACTDQVVPSVLLDVGLRGIDFVFGTMTAVRRQALDGIGDFEPLSQGVAEGFAMGWLIARNGWKVVLSPYACETAVAERDFAALFLREVGWQLAGRACRPFDHFLSIATYPLPLLLLLLLPRPTRRRLDRHRNKDRSTDRSRQSGSSQPILDNASAALPGAIARTRLLPGLGG